MSYILVEIMTSLTNIKSPSNAVRFLNDKRNNTPNNIKMSQLARESNKILSEIENFKKSTSLSKKDKVMLLGRVVKFSKRIIKQVSTDTAFITGTVASFILLEKSLKRMNKGLQVILGSSSLGTKLVDAPWKLLTGTTLTLIALAISMVSAVIGGHTTLVRKYYKRSRQSNNMKSKKNIPKY